MLAAACLILGRGRREREGRIGKGGKQRRDWVIRIRSGQRHTYVLSHRHTHTHTCTHMHAYTCMHMHAHIHTHRGHACMYACKHSYTHPAIQQLVFAVNLLPLNIASLLVCRLMTAILSVPRGEGV